MHSADGLCWSGLVPRIESDPNLLKIVGDAMASFRMATVGKRLALLTLVPLLALVFSAGVHILDAWRGLGGLG